MPIIRFSNVSLRYPDEKTLSLENISFSVDQGEFVCIVGPSGCGKSTVLKLISRLEKPTEGEVFTPTRVSMAFQGGALFPWLTVYDNVAFGLRAKGLREQYVHKIVERDLVLMQMNDFAQKYPGDLSGGQRQRVGIARALAVEPDVLLLDEPFSALDPKITHELHEDFVALWKHKKITIVLVSHLIEEAVSLADRVLVMKQGAIADSFPIHLAYPRRENATGFMHDVSLIRREFFS